MRRGSNHGSDWQSISRLHMNWADRYMAVWHACMLAVYAVAFLLLVTAGAGPSERTDAYIVLGALLIVGAVAVSRAHSRPHPYADRWYQP
jgi:hypothetical protein